MRTELSSPPTSSIHRPPSASESSTLAYSASPYGEDDQTAWAREEQQMMMRQQDQTMDSISGTLNILTQQASLMGQEIEEHNEYAFLSNYYTLSLPHSPSEKLINVILSSRLLDDLDRNVDRVDHKLQGAMQRMRKFLRDSEEKGSGYCIVFLIIVLLALLLAVILL